MIMKPGGYLSLPAFYYLTLVQHTKHPVPHPLNHLFYLIKFLAQFLHLIVIREQDQAAFRDLHGNARADLKARFSQPFGADFDHRRVAAVGQITRWQRDGRGRVRSRTDAMGRRTAFRYDAYGRLTRLTNENGEHYRFRHDVLDRLAEQTNPERTQRVHAGPPAPESAQKPGAAEHAAALRPYRAAET